MRFNFKKISAIASSVLLTGMTMGVAAAANYPAPFVDGGAADVAIVYGSGAGVSDLDKFEATSIQTDLADGIDSGAATSISGGESFTLEKSNKFNFNDALNDVYSNLGEDEMDFLAEGTYDDGDIDEDYTQEITLSSEVLELFSESDYEDKEPTVGFTIDDGDEILRYTVEYDDVLNYTEMVDTEIPLLGKSYYVLAASSSQIDLLDSAEKVVVARGEVANVNGKSISIEYIDEDEVIFNVGGDLTEKLEEHEYEELDDGSYIVLNSNLYDQKESGISKAEFSIGAGKLELIDGKDYIKVNDERDDGIVVDITDATGLDSLDIIWNADGDSFLTESNALTMPIFEAVSLEFGGLDYPDDSETISFDNGDTLTIMTGDLDLPVLYYDTTDDAAYLGEEDHELIVATGSANFSVPIQGVLTGGIDIEENERFIVTRIDDDLSSTEMLYYEVDLVENNSDNEITVELIDLIGDNDKTFDDIETIDIGDLTIGLQAVNGSATSDGDAYLNFSVNAGGGSITYNKVVSDMGMVITIPTTAAADGSGADFVLQEANEDEDVANGETILVTVKNTSNDKLHVASQNVSDQEESDDNFVGVVQSDLASTITFDSSNDENDFELEYFAKEVAAEVNVVAGATAETSVVAGAMVVKDSEVGDVSDKNLIVVGGSCINSVAADILGGALCGAAFTEATGVGSGEFIIKSVASPVNSDKIALLVAGYNVADTQAASQYLRTQDVDTSIDAEMVKTSTQVQLA